MRRWLGLIALVLGLLVGSAGAQTTTTTTTTTTTLVIAPSGDGRFVLVTADTALPIYPAPAERIVYVNTVGGDVTLTLPPTGCGCAIVPIKLTDDHLLHIRVADVGIEGITINLTQRVTSLDYDKSLAGGQPQLRFVANPSSQTWFPSF